MGPGPSSRSTPRRDARAMLASPFRADFAAEYGDLMFINAEIELKTFSPEIIPDLQKENDLTQAYEKLHGLGPDPLRGGRVHPVPDDPLQDRTLTMTRPLCGLEGGGPAGTWTIEQELDSPL